MRKVSDKILGIILMLLMIAWLSPFAVTFAQDNAPAPEDGEELVIDEGEDEEAEPTDEELAAEEAAEEARYQAVLKRAKELEEEVEGLGTNYNSIISLLLDDEKNMDPLFESKLLLEKLIEALLTEAKPDYSQIGKYGAALVGLDRQSSLGYYAQGLKWMNDPKKPDLKKAMDFLGRAKDAKKPYKDAASVYTSCMIKRFLWDTVAAVVGIIALAIGVIISKKKKKKNNTEDIHDDSGEINIVDGSALQKLLDETEEKPEDKTENNSEKEAENKELTNEVAKLDNDINAFFPGGNGQNTNTAKSENSDSNAFMPETEGAYNPFARNNTPAKPIEANTNPVPSDSKIQNPTVNSVSDNTNNQVASATANSDNNNTNINENNVGITTTVSPSGKKVVRVVKKVRVRRDANGNTYVIDSPTGDNANYQTSSQQQQELDEIRGMTRLTSKPVPPVDTQLDILWGNLSRKALQGQITPMYRRADAIQQTMGSTIGGGTIVGENASTHNIDVRFGDVSIDLSEEALKDDLIGKLKMLAISDSELRELFAMKNPAHIPHLIEYVMTKPEPMRLSFVAKELGNYGDPAVIDTLASLLYHEDERVVLAAIQGLEATKSPQAVVPLCPFLRSDVPLYAQAARTALSKFGAVKIMQALKDLPTFSDIKLKEAGIFVLSRMKGDAVEKILKALLNDNSSSVRIQVILAMSYQKNPDYIDSLREFYRIASEAEKSMTRKAIVYLQGFDK